MFKKALEQSVPLQALVDSKTPVGYASAALLEQLTRFDKITEGWRTKKDITWIYTEKLPMHMPALALPKEAKELVASIRATVIGLGAIPKEFPRELCSIRSISLAGERMEFSEKWVFMWSRCADQQWAIVL